MANVNQLASALQRLQQDVEQEAFPTVLDDAGEDIVWRARKDVPVDSGTLRDSLTCVRIDFEVSIGPDANAMNPQGNKPEDYGLGVELASPFLRPALDSSGPMIQQALKRRLEKI